MGVSGQKSSGRSKGRQNKRGGVDVLSLMVVTFAVFHLEMSALNAEASWNAVEGCRCRVMVDTIQKEEHRENVKIKAMGVSGEKSSEGSKGQQNKRGGVDVLSCMVVTAAVFHLEMSALNAEADWNAVGGCRCRVMVGPIQKKETSGKRKNKSNGGEWR